MAASSRRRRKLPGAPVRPADAPPIDYGGRHPFEVKSTNRRNLQGESPPLGFAPIRVVYDTATLTAFLSATINRGSDPLLATRLFLLLHYVLPQTAAQLTDMIRVIPVQGAIYPLSPNGKSQDYEFFCPSDKTGGIDGGGDLLVFVSINRFKCGKTTGFSTAASALSCERDQYDRPVTGAIDYCMEQFGAVTNIDNLKEIVDTMNNNSTVSEESLSVDNVLIVEQLIKVTLHELIHVLGFSSDSLRFFRNPTSGVPLTPRPFRVTQATCSNGLTTPVLGEPSPLVIGRGTDAITKMPYYEVRTPLVTQVVRNHFNCPSLSGARLENEPDSVDCFGSHWEGRLFYGELMSAFLTSTNNNPISPLTLAFLEDSSWYQANYQSEYVRAASFGHRGGCDFVQKPCIVNGAVPSYGEGNFCNSTMELTDQGFVLTQALPQICDPTFQYKAQCDLKVATKDDKVQEVSRLYFPNGPVKLPYEFTQAEFCPIPNQQPTNCRNKGDQFLVSKEYADARETNGPDSICVEVVTRDRAICLEAMCNQEIGRLQMTVLYGLNITCLYDGQIHTILGRSESPNGLPFQIKCPKLAQVCPDLVCPDECSGRGICVFDNNTETGHCECFDRNDHSPGCYNSTLKEVYSKLFVDSPSDIKRPNAFIPLVLVGSVVLGLACLHVWMKFKNDRFRREQNEVDGSATYRKVKQNSSMDTPSFRDEEDHASFY